MGEAEKFIFEFLLSKFNIANVFSYQETGIQKTWDRDKKYIPSYLIQNK